MNAEKEFCADVNRDISPDNGDGNSETLQCHNKLKKMAMHLAHICCATLRQQEEGEFSEEDQEFANLVFNCRNKLVGLGEYLIKLSNLVKNNNRNCTTSDLSSLSVNL